jgi:hypothetical protein
MSGGTGKKGTQRLRAASRKSASKTDTTRTGDIRDFFGMLAGKTKKVATIEEINKAAADGWAGLVKMGKK